MIVALNMIDVAKAQGITIDAVRLAKQLDVPVVLIQANKGVGLDELRQAIHETAAGLPPTRFPIFPDTFEAEETRISQLTPGVPLVIVRRMILDIGGYAETRSCAEYAQLRVNCLRRGGD